jgi:hypothetical protein
MRYGLRAIISGVLISITAFSPLPALAQDISPVFDMNVLGMNGAIEANNQYVMRGGGSQGGMAAAPPRIAWGQALSRPAQPGVAATRLTYAPTAALKKQAMAEFLDRVEKNDPKNAQATRAAFANQDYARIWQGIVAPFGLRANDTVDALTAYIVLGYLISTGAGDPPAGAVQGARAQVAALLARDPRFTTPKARASLGEEFKILFVALHGGWQSARREGNLRGYAQGVGGMFQKQSGIDFSGLVLGDGGFVRR